MMNGGNLYELAKLLGHSNIKMTERYAKLGRSHIAETGNTAKVIWNMLGGRNPQEDKLERKTPQGDAEAQIAHTA